MLYHKLTPEEVKEKFERKDKFRLIDVREKNELEICSIEFAEHYPMDDIINRLHEFDEDEEIIFMCHHGVRSGNVAFLFASRDLQKFQICQAAYTAGATVLTQTSKNTRYF